MQSLAGPFKVISAPSGLSNSPTIIRFKNDITAANGLEAHRVLLVLPNEYTSTTSSIAQSFVERACFPIIAVKLKDINPLHVPNGALIVALIEAEDSVLSNLIEADMQAIKILCQGADTILWTTGGNLLRGTRPDMAVVRGFCQSIRLEHYPLKFGILDFDCPKESPEIVGRTILDVLVALQTQARGDNEFILRSGLIYVSRMIQDPCLESSVAIRRNKKTTEILRNDLGVAQLITCRPGDISSVHLEQQRWLLDKVQDNEVEIEVLAVGLNAKDLYALMGRVDTKNSTNSLECTGIIRAVGKSVLGFESGDRVVVMAPHRFSNLIQVPVWCCCKLLAQESYQEMATVPLVLSTALYALRHRAQLKARNSVLIHSATGGLGQAAIQIARMIGADLFVTAGNEKKRRYLHEVLGISQNRIFASRDASFEAEVMRETAGRGVDVVLNSLSGDLLQASWRCTSEFRRFVEVGKKDISEAGSLDMSVFGRAASFSAFDLSDLYYSRDCEQNGVWGR